jgi:hypothetical protein
MRVFLFAFICLINHTTVKLTQYILLKAVGRCKE